MRACQADGSNLITMLRLSKKKQHEAIRQHYRVKIEQHIADLQAEGLDHIVVINGYPKSGNSWLCRIVAGYLDCAVSGYLGGPNDEEVSVRPPTGNQSVIVLKSHHMRADLAPLDTAFAKVLHIVRDPRDVTVSASAYFTKRVFRNKLARLAALVRFAGKLARRRASYPTWWLSGWAGYYEPLMDSGQHTVRYESLLDGETQDLENFLRDLCGAVDKEKLSQVLHENSFAAMKKTQDAMSQTLMRSGKSGGYKKEMPRFLSSYIKQRCEPVFSYFKYR